MTICFFDRAIAEGWLTFRGFASNSNPANGLDAVLGYVVRTPGATGKRTMTQPGFGYDTALPQSVGLYRLLSAQVFAEAREHGLAMDVSAGAGAFKQARGATPTPEFVTVVDRHLSPRRRGPSADMAVHASRDALAAGLDASDVNLVIRASGTPEQPILDGACCCTVGSG